MSEADLDALAAIFPAHPRAKLRKLLAASRGNVERATLALLDKGGIEEAVVSSQAGSGSSSSRRKRPRSEDGAGKVSLNNWLRPSPARPGSPSKDSKPNFEPLELSDSDDDTQHKPAPPTLPDAFAKLRAPPAAPAQQQPLQSPALPPLTLATPEMVYKHTEGLCTLITDFLPRDLAGRLFARMIRESRGEGECPAWEKTRFHLFDRQVESPHTTSLYVERFVAEQGAKKPAFDRRGLEEAAEQWYNGEKRRTEPFVEEMDETRELVATRVREVLSTRQRHPLEWQGDWEPNVAAANKYKGRNESVGAHTDSMTYLGPYTTIASLSLGVERVFRIRSYTPNSASSATSSARPPAPGPSTPGPSGSLTPAPPPPPPPAPAARTFNIPLPHNSLLIMHAGMQEGFKHSVPPVGAGGMDLFRLPKGLEGVDSRLAEERFDERINLTFRFFRPDFAPLPPGTPAPPPFSYAGTPICPCGVPCVLRVDGRGTLKSRLTQAGPVLEQDEADLEEEVARGVKSHFWQCNAASSKEGKTCGLFRPLDFKREGRGRWFVPPSQGGGGEETSEQ